MIGFDNFKLLRLFLLANRAQLITLTNDLKVNVPYPGFQFLVTSRSPESELIFQEKKKQYGTKWLWHGSRAERWYRILHTGLHDYGNTKYQLHAGPIYGDGIYMSDLSSVSYWYSETAQNGFVHSKLPKCLHILSLIENAAVPELNGPVAQNEFTQRDEQACITRVIFVNDGNDQRNNHVSFNSLNSVIVVPTLKDVIQAQFDLEK